MDALGVIRRFSVVISSFQTAWRSPTPGKLLRLPFSPFASSATPTPSTNHHWFLSKNGNCLKLKLHCASAGFGGYEKKMEERRGWDVLTKIIWVITSWKMWQCTRSLLRSQRGQEGGGCAQASHNLTRKAQGGCHLNFWGFPSAKNSQGTSLLYPLLSHKKKKKNPCESSSSVWKSTWTCDPEIPAVSCKQE